jgi:RNA polymerase II-associated factor 1
MDTSSHSLDPRDKALLLPPAQSQSEKVATAARPIVTWLRRTEYITGTKNSNQQHSKRDARQSAASSIDDPVAIITSTFEYDEDLANIKHPGKPGLKALESFALFPDFEIWPNEYVHVVYDSHPIGSTVRL